MRFERPWYNADRVEGRGLGLGFGLDAGLEALRSSFVSVEEALAQNPPIIATTGLATTACLLILVAVDIAVSWANVAVAIVNVSCGQAEAETAGTVLLFVYTAWSTRPDPAPPSRPSSFDLPLTTLDQLGHLLRPPPFPPPIIARSLASTSTSHLVQPHTFPGCQTLSRAGQFFLQILNLLCF
jgi:hypothetical protein